MSTHISVIDLKQCRVCKFTKLAKHFTPNQRNKDGLTGACRTCLNAQERERRVLAKTWHAARFAGGLLLCLLPLAASAAELPPEHLDEIHVRHQSIMHNVREGSSYAVLWFNNGFGTVDFDDESRPRVWRLFADGEPYKYTWFAIKDDTNGSLDDYWFCERATWDQYATSGDVAALKANSWHCRQFLVLSSYEPPELPDPVTWEDRTDVLTVGYVGRSTLIVVKQQEGATWEWTIRGTEGLTGWEFAETLSEAKHAAEEAIKEL